MQLIDEHILNASPEELTQLQQTDVNTQLDWIWFYDVFAARLGLNDEKLTIGFGIKTKIWLIDAAIVAHEELGSTYRISLGCSFVK